MPTLIAINSNPDDPAVSSDESILTKLRLDQSYSPDAGGVATQKLLTTIPIRRPDKAEFFRCHPKHWIDTNVVELKYPEREILFATNPRVVELLQGFVHPTRLRLTISRQGVLTLWPIKLPVEERRRGNGNWSRSALEASQYAERQWVRITANMGLGAYEMLTAVNDLGEPQWPTEDFEQILRIATRDLLIEKEDHVVIRDLLGRQ